MPVANRLVLMMCIAGLCAACGDDGGGTVDAGANGADANVNAADAPLNGVDATPRIDATPLPPDASTVGHACSFVETVQIILSNGIGGAMLCVDPGTGANCRVIEQTRTSCFNDQAGFVFGINQNAPAAQQRAIAGADGVTITAASIGTITGPVLGTIPDATQGTVTGQTAGGQSYTVDFRFNDTVLTLTSISGPN